MTPEELSEGWQELRESHVALARQGVPQMNAVADWIHGCGIAWEFLDAEFTADSLALANAYRRFADRWAHIADRLEALTPEVLEQIGEPHWFVDPDQKPDA